MVDLLSAWCLPPGKRVLQQNEVHVWLATQEMFQATIPRLHHLLSSEDAKKAAQFYFEKDRLRFIIAHGLLRVLLGEYTGLAPEQIRFCYNEYGKPALDFSQKGQLNFNLSHTRDLVVYAFTHARDVGIDIEYIHPDIDYEQLARHHFSTREYTLLQNLPLSVRRDAFFQCWTRKEAYIKARGRGLSLALDSFDVTVEPDAPIELLASREDIQETTRWLFKPLVLGTNYAGTIVVEGRDWYMYGWRVLPHMLSSPQKKQSSEQE